MAETLSLDQIRDGGAQMRVEMTEAIIQEYAEAMVAGDVFPPIIVFFDDSDHWLADGFHRTGAAKMLGRESIDADVRQGTQRDALLYGIGSNAKHGLRRTQADKRKAVATLLADEQWSKWSDRKIATAAGCDHKTVGKIRRELTGEIPSDRKVLYRDRHGNTSEMHIRPSEASDGPVLGSVLKRISDDDLKLECRRRGWSVEVGS